MTAALIRLGALAIFVAVLPAVAAWRAHPDHKDQAREIARQTRPRAAVGLFLAWLILEWGVLL